MGVRGKVAGQVANRLRIRRASYRAFHCGEKKDDNEDDNVVHKRILLKCNENQRWRQLLNKKWLH